MDIFVGDMQQIIQGEVMSWNLKDYDILKKQKQKNFIN